MDTDSKINTTISNSAAESSPASVSSPSSATSTTTNTTTTINTTNNGSTSSGIGSEGTISNNEPHRTQNLENLSRTNLYIKGLQTTTTDRDLYDMCSRFGKIMSTKAIIDKNSNPRGCKGYGFVEFFSPQSAHLAVQELTKSGVQAQMAKIHYSQHTNHNHNHHNNHYQHHHHHHHQQHHNNPNSSNNGNNIRNNGNHHQHRNSNNLGYHSNHLTDLAIMTSMGLPRPPYPGYPPKPVPGYPTPVVAPTNGPQWLHPAGAGQPYVVTPQLIQAGGLTPPPPALHYGPIPHLTSQIQGFQFGDPIRYMPHQWHPNLWLGIHQQPPPSDLSMAIHAPMHQQNPTTPTPTPTTITPTTATTTLQQQSQPSATVQP